MLLGFTLALPLHLYIVTGRVYPTAIVIVHLLSAHCVTSCTYDCLHHITITVNKSHVTLTCATVLGLCFWSILCCDSFAVTIYLKWVCRPMSYGY